MSVSLVSFSKSNLVGCENLQELVAYCARVSNPANQNNKLTSQRLLSYLIKNKHWSPFEMVSICLEIVTTRDIAHQIVRHRSFSFQEFSQRYANPIELPFVFRECRMQDPKNRQSSTPCLNDTLVSEWQQKQQEITDLASEHYTWALEQGIAKEVARVILPEGNTPSRLYMNGTLRSWLHYIDVRDGWGTQKEHETIARACGDVLAAILPDLFHTSVENIV